ncbi:hypothetical protein [Caulobacter segnis]|uniref:O-antigen polymerase n=1 Tax=Caulobacter segnis (strain ATCC 21756 / DSM 7131 / JCM 7823 / NBRC 15250 / LMG 17158 / TK0059) TaxID=509190 RepID=D5VHN9_CAUST|nr:hypothetical protein [Caulobacter segnis]ADG09020.1 hypothetical protein Cseg_0507 [Caulobacter segnis ATCC 21756]
MPPRKRLDSLSLYTLYYMAVVIISTVLVVYVARIQGFARIPYINGMIYASLGLGALFYLFTRKRVINAPRGALITALAALPVLCSTIIGIFNQNSIIYIISWTIYTYVGALLFFTSYTDRSSDEDSRSILTSPWLYIFACTLSIVSSISPEPLLPYPLMAAIFIFGASQNGSNTNRLASLLGLVFLHLDLTSFTPKLAMSRASLLSLVAAIGVVLLYRRRYGILLGLITCIFLAYVAAVTVDASALKPLPRNLREGAMLLRGARLEDNIATFQRFYEVEMVKRDFEGATVAEVVFGKGLGRTIDMSGSLDASVGNNALQGMRSVNNIHFLPVAVFHKYGLAGIFVIIFMILYPAKSFIKDALSGRIDDSALYLYIYIFTAIVFSASASNYFIANPYLPLAIGALAAARRKLISANGYRLTRAHPSSRKAPLHA